MSDSPVGRRISLCQNCMKAFSPNLDKDLCDTCIREAYEHCPERYMKVTRIGGGTYIQPLNQLDTALEAELDGAEIGARWTLELIEMTPAEYERLPEFGGH